jgi:catabolite regulation protein CreA
MMIATITSKALKIILLVSGLLSIHHVSFVDSFALLVPSKVTATTRTTVVRYNMTPQTHDNQQRPTIKPSFPIQIKNLLLSTTLVLGMTFSPISTALGTTPAAYAESSKVVGALKGSGLVFKDTLQIERFEDPKVQGVVLYISNFDRPITEKLSGGNFFNDPSYASVACARTSGSIAIADNIAKGPQGEEVFEESRSLLFKTLRVQRIYDEEKKTVVYVSYNTRLDKNDDTNKSRFKSSLCAVSLD